VSVPVQVVNVTSSLNAVVLAAMLNTGDAVTLPLLLVPVVEATWALATAQPLALPPLFVALTKASAVRLEGAKPGGGGPSQGGATRRYECVQRDKGPERAGWRTRHMRRFTADRV
jgi:hypothetical protein